MPFRLLLLLALLVFRPALADEIVRAGDLEMHCMALPTLELTAEAARRYNVTREPGRGLLTVTILKKHNGGKPENRAAQVYAGAINLRNSLSSIPIRELRQADGVFYLGEFHVSVPDSLRFLVNANVLGRPLKAEFTREFNLR